MCGGIFLWVSHFQQPLYKITKKTIEAHLLLRSGKNNLITDISGIFVGNSYDEELRSGVTVIMPDCRCVASIDIRAVSYTHLTLPTKRIV